MNNKIVKEVFIIVLLFIVIMFCLGILFYDSMSVNTKDIVSVKYQTSDSVNCVLTERQDNSGVDVKKQTSNSILQSYSIDADDLKSYAEDNSYESGKKDPFAETSETIDERVTTTTKPGTATTSQSANPVKTDKVEDNKKQNTEEIKKEPTKVTGSVQNTVNNGVSKDKTESNKSNVGTFFEKENSK